MRGQTFSLIPEDRKAIACLNRFLVNGGGTENFSLIPIMGHETRQLAWQELPEEKWAGRQVERPVLWAVKDFTKYSQESKNVLTWAGPGKSTSLIGSAIASKKMLREICK